MPQSVQITETSPLLHDANCVYCHVDLVLNDHAVVCERCKSPHHHDCWGANNEQCATFGCKGSGAVGPQNVTRTEDSRSVPLASRPPSDEVRASLRAANDEDRIASLRMVGFVMPPILIFTVLMPLFGIVGTSSTLGLSLGAIFAGVAFITCVFTEGDRSIAPASRRLLLDLRIFGVSTLPALVLMGLMSLFEVEVAFSVFGLFGGLAFIYLLIKMGE